MWPRLDSIRVAAADRCVAMTTLPPPVIQLPPRTPLSRPLPHPRRRRTLPSPQHPPSPSRWGGWVDGCPLIAPFVTSSTVIVSHHDPLRGSVSRGISRRGRRRYMRHPPILIDAFLRHIVRDLPLPLIYPPPLHPIRKTTDFHALS